jgi:NAD(P)-dependent dehydrogenase (short-subunit alcohol dehydrogenase family)
MRILITGGGGVLAGLFARRLAREAKARITLIGRSPANDAVRATLAACPGALYRQADVTDQGALAAVVAESATDSDVWSTALLVGGPEVLQGGPVEQWWELGEG